MPFSFAKIQNLGKEEAFFADEFTMLFNYDLTPHFANIMLAEVFSQKFYFINFDLHIFQWINNNKFVFVYIFLYYLIIS